MMEKKFLEMKELIKKEVKEKQKLKKAKESYKKDRNLLNAKYKKLKAEF